MAAPGPTQQSAQYQHLMRRAKAIRRLRGDAARAAGREYLKGLKLMLERRERRNA